MENNVVTLETAKKLKAAGFPQTSAYMWREFRDGGGELQRRRGRQIGEFEFAAPTAQEIADQLPSTTVVYIFKERLKNAYSARYRLDPVMNWTMVDGPTMAEALAALWLKLQESGDTE